MNKPTLEPLSEDVVRRVARILGENSSANEALLKAETIRASGKKVAFYVGRHKGQQYMVVEELE